MAIHEERCVLLLLVVAAGAGKALQLLKEPGLWRRQEQGQERGKARGGGRGRCRGESKVRAGASEG